MDTGEPGRGLAALTLHVNPLPSRVPSRIRGIIDHATCRPHLAAAKDPDLRHILGLLHLEEGSSPLDREGLFNSVGYSPRCYLLLKWKRGRPKAIMTHASLAELNCLMPHMTPEF
ncbi:hypothetical protein AAE478_008458 [Parahypoxylon ruwenzoriense]